MQTKFQSSVCIQTYSSKTLHKQVIHKPRPCCITCQHSWMHSVFLGYFFQGGASSSLSSLAARTVACCPLVLPTHHHLQLSSQGSISFLCHLTSWIHQRQEHSLDLLLYNKHWFNQSINPSNEQPTKQFVSQSINQLLKQSMNQSIHFHRFTQAHSWYSDKFLINPIS